MTKFASPIRTFEVDLDGSGKKFTTFRMALNYTAIGILCDEWGIDLDKLDARLNKLDAKQIPDVVYASMAAIDPNLTKDDARAFCGALTVPDLIGVVQELVGASTPNLETVNGTGKRTPKNPPRPSLR